MYKVSENYRKVIYGGSARNMPKLSIGGTIIPPAQISRIVIDSPIIDTNFEVFYIGTFISQKLTITFRDIENIPKDGEIYLEIGSFVDGDYEYVPIGYFYIDESNTDFYSKKELVCLDKAVLFKPNVDYSSALVEGKITVEDLLKWLCGHYGVELGSYPSEHPNAKKTISSYDSTLSGKTFISWIAELLGSNAKIGRDGKLYILPIISEPVVKINATRGKSWKLGDKYEISSVTFDNGVLFKECKVDDVKANNLYLRQENSFIQEQDFEERVTNIFDSVKSFSIYNVECENEGDLSLDCSDIVTYTLGTDEEGNEISYNTFYNSTITYDMTIMGKVLTKIPSKQVEKTTNYIRSDPMDAIRRVTTTVNQLEGTIETVATQTQQLDTTVNNNYQDLINKFGDFATTSDIVTLQESVSNLQTSSYTKTEVNKILEGTFVDENGNEVIAKIVKTTSAKFDEDGMHYEKTGAETSSTINEVGLSVDTQNDTQILFAGYDEELKESVVRSDNLYVKKYFVISNTSRFEKYNRGIGCYWIGD